jgi:outer membrane protein
MLIRNRRIYIQVAEMAAMMLGAAAILMSQQVNPPDNLTISQAVDAALKGYPSIQVSQEQIDAAAAGIELARAAYLPRVDTLAQVNRATRNNVFGLLLPQSVIPSMSGPVLGSNSFGTAWGSAVGTLVAWEPFDFGLRRANIASSTAARERSEAGLERTRFDVAAATADSYLTLLAAQETIRGAQAGVDRAQVILQTISALVKSELRPGADASRAEAELAAVQTQRIQAEQAYEIARANLSRFIGLDPKQINASAPKLLQLPPPSNPIPPDIATNPIAREQNAVIEQMRLQLKALHKSYFPRFFLQGSAYARGTGAETNGDRLGDLNGLVPTTQNYALGLTVTFPVMDFAGIRAQESGQSARIRGETAKYRQIATDLKAQWNAAESGLQGARRIADNTPIQVSAARTTLEQSTARYRSGLGTIDEVAESQRLLTQAEINDALARLGVWRALLSVAQATGDVQPFLAEANR